jgi:hypothetical protein
VPKAKTIADLLAEQPAEELARLRDTNLRDQARARAALADLEVQGRLIETALAKRGKPGRPGKLTSTMVLEAAVSTPSPMTATDVHETLTKSGLDVSVNSVRNHLNRLVESRDLERDAEKKYVVPTPVFVPSEFVPSSGAAADFPAAQPDDDIPF